MVDRDQLINALKKADAAGDVDAAKAIARRIKSMDAPVDESPQAISEPQQPADDPSFGELPFRPLGIDTGLIPRAALLPA